jgi:hypothetical protein
LCKNCNKATENKNVKINFETKNNLRKKKLLGLIHVRQLESTDYPLQANWRFIKWEVRSVCKIYQNNEEHGFGIHILNNSAVTGRNIGLWLRRTKYRIQSTVIAFIFIKEKVNL